MKPNRLLAIVICLLISTTLLTTKILADINRQMEYFIKNGDFTEAEKYCDHQQDDQKIEYYRILADVCFDNQCYDNAAKYYKIAGNWEGLKRVADYFYCDEQYEKAGKYYNLTGNKKGLENSYSKLADSYFYMKDKTFSGHSSTIYSVAISADNHYIVSGSADKTIKLWDPASAKVVRTFSEFKGPVVSVAISSDHHYLVSNSYDQSVLENYDQSIILWDLATGKKLRTFFRRKAVSAPTILPVSISLDNRFVSGINNQTIMLWNLSNGKEVRTFSGHNGPVNSLTISVDDHYIATGSGDQTVKLWDTATGKELRTFSGHNGPIYSVAISADNRYIVSGSGDQTIKLWDPANGNEVRSFFGHKGPVYSVTISTDNRYIASGSEDGTIKLWDVASGKELQTFFENKGDMTHSVHPVYSVAISADNCCIICGNAQNAVQCLMIDRDYVSEKAADYYEKAGNQVGLTKVADAAFSKANYDKAAEYYDKAGNKEGLRKIAGVYLNSETYEKAIDLFLRTEDNENTAYNKVADAAFTKTGYDKAAEYYEKAGNKEGLRKVADAYLNNGSYETAIDFYLKLGDNEKTVYNKAADAAFSKTDYDKAIAYYEKTGSKERLRKIADACLNNGGYEMAITIYLKLGDNEKTVYNKAADAAFSKTDYIQAAEYYEDADNKEGASLIEAIYNLDNADASIRIQSAQILSERNDQRVIPILVQSLPDWEAGPDVADALKKFGWQPKTAAEKVHYFVALRYSEGLKSIWPQTKQVLLNDMVATKVIMLNALYAFIGIGRREIINDLINTLNGNGSVEIAKAYLNCGTPELHDAAVEWAHNHGYTVLQGRGAPPVSWGSM